MLISFALGLWGSVAAADQAEEVLGDRLEVPSSRPPHVYLRTALEELGFLGLQTAWYWGHSFHGDEKFNFQNWSTRLTSYHDMVLDDDKFRTGAVGHPIAGTGYYLIARGNGFGALASFAITTMASTTWQYFSEWNEKPATNDLLVTPIAGWAIGEASYRLGQYFLASPPNVFDCVGAALFSPVATYNDARACRLRTRDQEVEQNFVRSSHPGHPLDVGIGTSHTTFGGGARVSELALEADARLTTHRLYRRAGEGRSTARPGQWTTLAADWLLASGGTRGVLFHADSVAVGDYRRRYDPAFEAAGPDGWGRLLAVGSAYDYSSRAFGTSWDRVMSVGIAGPVLEVTATRREIELRGKAALYYGFAQVTSLAYAHVAESLTGQDIRTVLQRQGYYYGQAVLPSAEVDATYGRVRLTLAGRAGAYWSIDHDDSHQSQLTNRFSLRDLRLRTSTALSLQPSRGPCRVVLEVVNAFWDSTLPGHTVTAREETVGAMVLVAL